MDIFARQGSWRIILRANLPRVEGQVRRKAKRRKKPEAGHRELKHVADAFVPRGELVGARADKFTEDADPKMREAPRWVVGRIPDPVCAVWSLVIAPGGRWRSPSSTTSARTSRNAPPCRLDKQYATEASQAAFAGGVGQARSSAAQRNSLGLSRVAMCSAEAATLRSPITANIARSSSIISSASDSVSSSQRPHSRFRIRYR